MRTIAIIPARAGSKRIPGKNTKLFEGRPMLAYAIDAARASGLFDRVFVSTDAPETAQLAVQLGAESPFLRSAATASDRATTLSVLVEVLQQLEAQGQRFELGCCIYPCNPFLTAELLRRGLQHLEEHGLDCVFTAVRYGHPVQRAFELEAERIRLREPEAVQAGTQELPPVYHDAAQFYWFRSQVALSRPSLWTENTGIIEVSELRAQDIDTPEDWELARLKYRALQGTLS